MHSPSLHNCRFLGNPSICTYGVNKKVFAFLLLNSVMFTFSVRCFLSFFNNKFPSLMWPQFTQLSEPNFWAAISVFETQLSGIEATLDQLTNATKR